MAKNKIKVKPSGKDKEDFNKSDVLAEKSIFNFWVLAVLLITFLIFKPSLKYGFVNWDDYESLVNNVNLASFGKEWSWAAVKNIFASDVLGAYIPLSSLSFALEKYFFAPDPAAHPSVFHFTNLFLHLVSTCLVFFLFTKLFKNKLPALFGALLFGIHPMHIESVAWVTERKDVLYGMFFLLSLLAYIRYIQEGSKKLLWYGLALLLSIFSYFSKIQAVTLPLTMVVIDMLLGRDWRSLKLLILEKLPWWILSLLFGCINIYFLLQTKTVRLEGSELSYSFFEKIALAVYSYVEYLIKFLYPYKLSPIYPFPAEVPLQAYLYVIGLLIFFTAIGIWSYKSKSYWFLYGLAFFTVNIIFMLQIVVAGQTFMADRYSYIAYIGLIFVFAKGLEFLQEKYKPYQFVLYSFLALYIGFLIYLSNRQVKVWASTKKLWEHTLSVLPGEKIALRNLAQYYLDEEKDYVKGINILNYAISQDSINAALYNNLGKAYTDKASGINQNTPENAAMYKELMTLSLQTYNKAYQIDSSEGRKRPELTANILINRAVAKAGLGLLKEAIGDIDHGLEYNPLNKTGHSNRATIYFHLGEHEMAVQSFNSAIQLEPYNGDLYFQRGMSKYELRKYGEALQDVEKAFSLNKGQPVYFLGRAQVYKAMGDKVNYLKDITSAKESGLDVPEDLFK
jgi:protein O-mannosyl-transferase